MTYVNQLTHQACHPANRLHEIRQLVEDLHDQENLRKLNECRVVHSTSTSVDDSINGSVTTFFPLPAIFHFWLLLRDERMEPLRRIFTDTVMPYCGIPVDPTGTIGEEATA